MLKHFSLSIFFLLLIHVILPAQCPPQDSIMEIGMGLAGPSYWSQETPFKNLILQASSNFITYDPAGGGAWDTQVGSELSYTAEGYPTEIPQTTSIGKQNVRLVITADGYAPLGQYVFLYDGQGQISFYGALSEVNTTSGRVRVDVVNTGNGWLHIENSDANDPLRNFRLVPLIYEFDYETAPFTPEFLEKTGQFYTLRFMDWFHTNNWDSEWAEDDGSPAAIRFLEEKEWADRASKDYYSQAGGKGIAYEYAIELSNTLDRHPWICVPHNASDDYMRQMARLFRDSLDDGLQIYLEYSNELWNGIFHQFHFIQRQIATRWPGLNHSQAGATRAADLFRIWREEFGADSLRIVRVCGTQTANPWIGEQAMGIHGPDGFDALGITWYFGISNPWGASDPQLRFRDRLEALGGSATPQDVIDLAREDFYHYYDHYRENAAAVGLYNKPLISYEGGSHIIHSDNIQNDTLLQTMFDAENSQAMYDLYDEVIDSMRTLNMTILMPFVLTGGQSIWGDWGHLRTIFDTAPYHPKYQVLLDNLDSCRAQAVTTSLKPALEEGWGITIFPVPVLQGNMVNIEYLSEPGEILNFTLISIDGKSCWNERVTSSGTQQQLAFDTKRLSPGVYQLICRSMTRPGMMEARKLMIW